MRTIIAGSRHINDEAVVLAAAEAAPWEITEVVCGGAAGVDSIGAKLARERNVPVKMFPADWGKHGRAAGPIRNREMADYAQALVAVWDGLSRGTKNMIDEARARGLTVHVHQVDRR